MTVLLAQTDISKAIYTCSLGDGDLKADASIRLGALDKTDIWVPNINANKWDNEAWLNLNPRWFEVGKSATQDFRLSTAEVTVGDVKIKSWPLSNDVLEYAVCFSFIPTFENIVLEVQHSGLEFYFQPELTEDEVKEGQERIPRVIGSYAVYHGKKNNQYKTGKFAHLYRWECIDAKGNKAWCGNLNFDGNNLYIPLPVDWLKKAVYPVICMGAGDTFGYTSAGGTSLTAANQWLTLFTGFPGGTISAIKAFVKNTHVSTTYYLNTAVFDDSSGYPGDKVVEREESIAANTSAWTEKTFNCDDTIVAASDIWVGIWGSGSSYCVGSYDTGTGDESHDDYKGFSAGTSWDATYPAGDADINARVAVYVEYVATGGTTILPLVYHYMHH